MKSYAQRSIAETSPIWRRTSSPQRVVENEAIAAIGFRWVLADWQSRRLGGEAVRVVGGNAVPNSPNFALAQFFDALVVWRQGGVVFEERFSWPVQGWSRQYVCDEIQVYAVRNAGPGFEVPYEPGWILGASINEMVITRQTVVARVDVTAFGVYLPIRPPIATTRLRLHASNYNGVAGFASDDGGLPGSPQNLGVPTEPEFASAFNEWRMWNPNFGLISYAIAAIILGASPVLWEFEIL